MILLPAPIADFEAYRQRRDERLASEHPACPLIATPVRELDPTFLDEYEARLDKLDAAINEATQRPRVPREFDGPAAA